MTILFEALSQMARREADAAFSCSHRMPQTRILVLECPVCGAGLQEAAAYIRTLPLWPSSGDVDIAMSSDAPGGAMQLTVTVLGCEALAPRAFLAVAVAAHRFKGSEVRLSSRAARWATDGGPDIERLVLALNRDEQWADSLVTGAPGVSEAVLVLPASTRLNPVLGAASPEGYRATARSHFLSPHTLQSPPWLVGASAEYQRLRLARAAEALREEVCGKSSCCVAGRLPERADPRWKRVCVGSGYDEELGSRDV